MSVRSGIQIIVNADVNKSGITAGKVYVAQGGLHELKGATVISDEKTVKYLEPSEFDYVNESDRPMQEAKEPDVQSNRLDKYFLPDE